MKTLLLIALMALVGCKEGNVFNPEQARAEAIATAYASCKSMCSDRVHSYVSERCLCLPPKGEEKNFVFCKPGY